MLGILCLFSYATSKAIISGHNSPIGVPRPASVVSEHLVAAASVHSRAGRLLERRAQGGLGAGGRGRRRATQGLPPQAKGGP